jgi:membrane-bound lytic murein transglycosylase MltF
MRRHAIGLLLLPLVLPLLAAGKELPSVDSHHWTRNYDSQFKKWSKRYFGPNFDWRWFKAQAIAESGLKRNAKGPTGSLGVMQIQPGTYRDIKKKNPHFLSINDPEWNIAAGIYYNHQMYRQWADRVPMPDRLAFMFASYNASYDRIRRAAERAAKAGRSESNWADVAKYVPKTARHYVDKIRGLMRGVVEDTPPEDEPFPEEELEAEA